MPTQKIKTGLLISVILGATMMASPDTGNSYQVKPDYDHFAHQTHVGTVKIPGSLETRDLKCDSCHEQRVLRSTAIRLVATTERNQRLQVDFPGHRACVECHIAQIVKRQTCSICHSLKEGLTSSPRLRDFPARQDYNSYFDGKQHADHVNQYGLSDGRKLDCVYCHKPTSKQAALAVPSHPECYVCHAPGSSDAKASLKAGCFVCHTQMVNRAEPFLRRYASRAYGASFSHRTHVAYAGQKCDTCHTIEGRYSQPLPAPRKLRVKEHLSPGERSGRGCFSCHDGATHYGRAVFSGEDASSCVKCHKMQDKNGRPMVRLTEG